MLVITRRYATLLGFVAGCGLLALISRLGGWLARLRWFHQHSPILHQGLDERRVRLAVMEICGC